MTTRRTGLLLAAWSTAFALVHGAWALGWRGGVPADVAPISERPVFLAYDVVSGLLMLGAAYVAVRLTDPRVRPATRRRLETLTVVGSALALLRGVPALAIDLTTTSFTTVGILADTWFVVAGVLGVALWRLSRSAQAPSLSPKNPSTRATAASSRCVVSVE